MITYDLPRNISGYGIKYDIRKKDKTDKINKGSRIKKYYTG
jgi:hypothetical protein